MGDPFNRLSNKLVLQTRLSHRLFQGKLDKFGAQLGEGHACGASGIGKKRRSRHTGNGVRLQRPAITVVFQDEVSARGAAARE